jgi:hypothetical protein
MDPCENPRKHEGHETDRVKPQMNTDEHRYGSKWEAELKPRRREDHETRSSNDEGRMTIETRNPNERPMEPQMNADRRGFSPDPGTAIGADRRASAVRESQNGQRAKPRRHERHETDRVKPLMNTDEHRCGSKWDAEWKPREHEGHETDDYQGT